MGESIIIAYLCDGMQSCSEKAGCFRNGEPLGVCRYPFDPDRAVNGAEEHPEAHPERFRFVKTPGDIPMFWEGGIDIP